jgi:hypothetical protein
VTDPTEQRTALVALLERALNNTAADAHLIG